MTDGIASAVIGLLGAVVGGVIVSILGPIIQSRVNRNEMLVGKMRDCFQVFLLQLDGFYTLTDSSEKIARACEQYRMAWLVAPDNVVRTINCWLERQGITRPEPGTREGATGAMVLSMRQSIHPGTALQAADFLLVSPTKRE